MLIMSTDIFVKVTAQGELEIPPEFRAKLQPFTEYKVSLTENEIVFKKISKPITLKEIRQRVNERGLDSEQPTLEEISQIVKEVRQELWTEK
jgi:bifunctional DNA-binding transcriptional regulator/antitoxin component of YhaV-PrlF toxin-antitoxin module